MFKIKMLCFDYGNPTPYEDEPVYKNNQYETYKEAYDTAMQMAIGEAESLNEDCYKFTSFGVVQDEPEVNKKEYIRVLCYTLEDETDTTGETNQVTTYWVEEVENA